MFIKALPLKYRPRRNPNRRRRNTTPPAALTLVSATYAEASSNTLAFDRAIDITAASGAAIIVDDGSFTGSRWIGVESPPTLVNATTVQFEVSEEGPAQSAETVLTATSANGIVATDDGGTWPGATDVELPYP
jgi:hypothetical protein